MGWFFFVAGAGSFALTVWNVYQARSRPEPAMRAWSTKGAVLCAAFACLCVASGIPQSIAFMTNVPAVGVTVWGAWIVSAPALWIPFLPSTLMRPVERFRGVPRYKALLGAVVLGRWTVTLTLCAFLLEGVLLRGLPDAAYFTGVFTVLAVGGTAMCGAMLVVGIIADRLYTDAGIVARRPKPTGQ